MDTLHMNVKEWSFAPQHIFDINCSIFAGIFFYRKKENLLTIVAVLGLLPSSKSLVSVVMYFKIPKFSEKVYQEVSRQEGAVPVLYSMYLTSYKANFPINCFAVRGNHLIGYTEFAACDAAACEEHIQGILKQNSVKNVTIKIFHEKARFTERLAQLQALEPGKKKQKF